VEKACLVHFAQADPCARRRGTTLSRTLSNTPSQISSKQKPVFPCYLMQQHEDLKWLHQE